MYLRIDVQATSNQRPRVTIMDGSERQLASSDDVPPADILNLAGVLDDLLMLDGRERGPQGDGPITRHVKAGLLKTMHGASQEASALVERSAEKLKLSRDIAKAVGV